MFHCLVILTSDHQLPAEGSMHPPAIPDTLHAQADIVTPSSVTTDARAEAKSIVRTLFSLKNAKDIVGISLVGESVFVILVAKTFLLLFV